MSIRGTIMRSSILAQSDCTVHEIAKWKEKGTQGSSTSVSAVSPVEHRGIVAFGLHYLGNKEVWCVDNLLGLSLFHSNT